MTRLPRPTRDANAASGPTGPDSAGALPEWDLSDLYTAEDAPELARDLEWLETECAAFARDYEGRLDELDAEGLLACIRRDERISTIAGRVMSYAGLRYHQLTTDGGRAKFLSDCQEKITRFTTPLVFFTLELNRLDDAALQGMYDENPELARYAPVLRRIRAMKPLPAFGRAGTLPARPQRCRRCVGTPVRRNRRRSDL